MISESLQVQVSILSHGHFYSSITTRTTLRLSHAGGGLAETIMISSSLLAPVTPSLTASLSGRPGLRRVTVTVTQAPRLAS